MVAIVMSGFAPDDRNKGLAGDWTDTLYQPVELEVVVIHPNRLNNAEGRQKRIQTIDRCSIDYTSEGLGPYCSLCRIKFPCGVTLKSCKYYKLFRIAVSMIGFSFVDLAFSKKLVGLFLQSNVFFGVPSGII